MWVLVLQWAWRLTRQVVDEAASPADYPLWFQEAELNWAENQLRHAKTRPDAKALIQLGRLQQSGVN
jgi:hypothetical protein